jgi:hypothetical protein
MATGFSRIKAKDFRNENREAFLQMDRAVSLTSGGSIIFRIQKDVNLLMTREDARETALAMLDCCDQWEKRKALGDATAELGDATAELGELIGEGRAIG